MAGDKTKILVVDDEPFISLLVSEFLSDEGFEVEATETAQQALAILARGDIALLVTDMRLPYMSGAELALAARQLQPTLPIIFATGLGADPEIAKGLDGRYALIGKPFDMTALGALVRQLLDG